MGTRSAKRSALSQLMIINRGSKRERREGGRGGRRSSHTHVANAAWPPSNLTPSASRGRIPPKRHSCNKETRLSFSLSKLECLNCIQFAAHLPHHSIFALIVQHFPSPSMRNMVCCQCDLRHISGAPYSHTPRLLSTLSWPH